MVWEGKFGPAFVLTAFLGLVGLIGGYVAITENTKSNREATLKLEKLVDRQQTLIEAIGNRVTRVEATTDSMNHALDRIEQRLTPPRNP